MTDSSPLATETGELPVLRPGSARSALSHEQFRRIFIASFGSNIGSWIQNVVLPIYIYERTGKASIVALLILAQMGPLLLLAIPAGVIADAVDRRKWLMAMQVVMLTFSVVLAALARVDAPIWAIFLAQLGVGIGGALNMPAWSALLPSLLPHADLPGAMSLNSTLINGSRVVGPILVALFTPLGAEAWHFFAFNALTYLLVVWALSRTATPRHTADDTRGWQRFTFAFRVARDRPAVCRLILTLALYSLISLPYIGLFPAVAEMNFGIDGSTATYKWLYAVWALGAALGGLALGTLFVGRDPRVLIRFGFAANAVAMLAFAASRSAVPAFVAGFALGVSYFFTTTAMSTVMQSRLAPHERGRTMALWFMSFGGTVPIGNMIFGPLIDAYGTRWLLFVGAAWAVVLAWWCDIRAIDEREAQPSA
ncbi:MAG: MFS transporter [Actinobacteria bacterium]|nr:MFS transporter [Actinomycetota bacterium]